MLTFEQMLVRFVIALALGALLGVERELVGKGGAGVRTEMLVAGGASLFTIIALVLPYITAATLGTVPDLLAVNSSFGVIANIVVGIGFLGAGLIIKINDHPHNITTAALVWITAAIGVLAGLGMVSLAATCAILTAFLLYVLRRTSFSEKNNRKSAD